MEGVLVSPGAAARGVPPLEVGNTPVGGGQGAQTSCAGPYVGFIWGLHVSQSTLTMSWDSTFTSQILLDSLNSKILPIHKKPVACSNVKF